MASWAKVVLHDHAIATSKVIRLGLHCERPSLSISPVSPRVSGSWYVAPAGTMDEASQLPLSIAAAAVTSLNVDPGGSVIWMPAVEQRLGGVLVELVVVLGDRREVVGGQQVGVEGRQRDVGQDLAGRRLDGDHGSLDVRPEGPQPVERRGLGVRVEWSARPGRPRCCCR